MSERKIIQVEDKVPFKLLLPLSIQHMFAMFGASVLVPFIFGINPAIVLFMNFNQIAMLQKLKSSMDRFRNNHPKFPLFLKAVVGNALEEGTLVEINVTTPEGKNYCTNLKLKQEDLEFFQTLSEMGSQH